MLNLQHSNLWEIAKKKKKHTTSTKDAQTMRQRQRSGLVCKSSSNTPYSLTVCLVLFFHVFFFCCKCCLWESFLSVSPPAWAVNNVYTTSIITHETVRLFFRCVNVCLRHTLTHSLTKNPVSSSIVAELRFISSFALRGHVSSHVCWRVFFFLFERCNWDIMGGDYWLRKWFWITVWNWLEIVIRRIGLIELKEVKLFEKY